MSSSYHHLSPEERASIMIQHSQGATLSSIARLLGRHRSTISRELSRQAHRPYSATRAANCYRHARRRCGRPIKLQAGKRLSERVVSMLEYRQWSPEQIAEKLKREHPHDPSMHVSHETIYAWVYAQPRNHLKRLLVSQLRQAKPKRGRRASASSCSTIQVPDHQTIHQRPADIEGREFPGHWEGDLIIGQLNQSCIGTLVERKTGFLVLCKMENKSAAAVREGFERQFKKIDSFLRLSMTYDRGSEMAEHPLMSKHLKMAIYFADPHAPWQRGSNENINGLLRQYFPKGSDLSGVSQVRLNDVAWLLNTRPRKRFDFQTPQELFDQATADYLNHVALDS